MDSRGSATIFPIRLRNVLRACRAVSNNTQVMPLDVAHLCSWLLARPDGCEGMTYAEAAKLLQAEIIENFERWSDRHLPKRSRLTE